MEKQTLNTAAEHGVTQTKRSASNFGIPIKNLSTSRRPAIFKMPSNTGIPVNELCVKRRGKDQTPLQYVWSLNASRRHLNASQLAAVAAEIAERIKKPRGTRTDLAPSGAKSESSPMRNKRTASAEAARKTKKGNGIKRYGF